MAVKAGGGRIRIIGGTLRNSRLQVLKVPGLRPTPERVRETLFNWLAPVIAGARCLDLCAGSGALGIEALSRGARSVHFVERDPSAVQALRANLLRLGCEAQVSQADALQVLRAQAQPHDLVFLDPPFAQALWTPLAQELERGGWLAPAAWIYVEHARGQPPGLPGNWHMHRFGQAGEVSYVLYRRGPELPLS